jgi:hypothetical protein
MTETEQQTKAKHISLYTSLAETALLCTYALGWNGALTLYAIGATVSALLIVFALAWTWKKPAILPERSRGEAWRDVAFGAWRVATIAALLYFTQYALAGMQTVVYFLGLYALARNRSKAAGQRSAG